MTITKQTLLKPIAQQLELSQTSTKPLIEAFFNIIIAIAKRGGIVNVPYLGHFHFAYQHPKAGRILQTNEPLGLVGAGYRLKCDITIKNKVIDTVIDESFVLHLSIATKLSLDVIRESVLAIGKEITNRLIDGERMEIRGFGRMERRQTKYDHYVFSSSKCLFQRISA